MFYEFSLPREAEYFNYDYEQCAIEFLKVYDQGEMLEIPSNKIMLDMINDNLSVDEIKATIDALKNGKSPGLDHIPTEFVKIGKDDLAEIITYALNYIIEKRDFPEVWALGQRTPVFKNGCHKNPNNYRGITILPIFAKIFETAVNRRVMFTNDAFSIVDRFNGGFLKGSRTSDNIFVLQGLVQRQLCLGKPLFICFVGFSKAFDLVNRHILFFKLIKSGFHARVFDTLRSLYKKTNFRVKIGGKLCSLIKDEHGVNQGGNASPTLFRKYLADLGEYLSEHVGICVSDNIIAHLLWADDLVLLSDTAAGLQTQLDGLLQFC